MSIIKKPCLNWITGRQDSADQKATYKKARIFQFGFSQFGFSGLFNNKGGVDCYLLHYEPYYKLKPHVDLVPKGLKHYRLNIVLKGSGDFDCEKKIINLFNRVVLFRPDKYTHAMKNGAKERLVLSIGLAV